MQYNCNKYVLLTLTTTILFINSFSVKATPKVLVVTEHYPPNSIISDSGEVSGFLVELTERIFKRAQLESHIIGLPWPRAYKTVLTTPNTLIFSIRRTTNRENLFKWAGSVFKQSQDPWNPSKHFKVSLLARKDANLDIATKQQLLTYSVSSTRNDALTDFLIDEYHWPKKKVLQAKDWAQSIKLMIQGRADLVAGYQGYFELYLEQQGLADKVKTVFEFPINNNNFKLHFAFNFQTDEAIIKKFTDARLSIMNDGSYEVLLKKWQSKSRQ